ncbi:hypothetical protein HDU93_009075 [Gonapodya sp. JEL0774]|nr:hypothetical protein HDU93_009075 [Gonapodya sp. JEL0774]
MRGRCRWLVVVLGIFSASLDTSRAQSASAPTPNLLLSSGSDFVAQLSLLASSYAAAPAGLRGAFEALDVKATQALKRISVSVTAKADPNVTAGLGVDWTTWASTTSAGLTANDYLTLCTYCFPVAGKPSAPWTNIDGKVNPLGSSFPDNKNWNTFQLTVLNLAHRYFIARYFPTISAPGSKAIADPEQYAAKAIAFIQTWYTDPATGMTPRLTFAQYRPNSDSFTGTGIIDWSAKYAPIVDAFTLLSTSPSWTSDFDASLKSWHSQLLDWLLNDPIGAAVGARLNNHVVWYDGMVVAIATWLGRSEVLVDFASRAKDLIGMQVTPTGVQLREEVRVGAWNYSTYNLLALTRLYATLDNPLPASYLGSTSVSYVPGSQSLWRSVSDGSNFTARYGGSAYNPAGTAIMGPPGASYQRIIEYLSGWVLNPQGWSDLHSGVDKNGTAFSDRVACTESFAEVVRRAYWTVAAGNMTYQTVLRTCLGGDTTDLEMADSTATWQGWIRVGEPWWRLREPLSVVAVGDMQSVSATASATLGAKATATGVASSTSKVSNPTVTQGAASSAATSKQGGGLSLRGDIASEHWVLPVIAVLIATFAY